MNHRTGFFSGRVARRECAAVFLSAWLCCAATAQQRLSETVHNLAVSGPGRVHAQSEQQICLFCHAPHNTAGVRPLWNRTASTASYLIYQSSTLNALPGQPNGSSKLCLSCHDGTIALGSVLNRPDQIRMTGGDFMPAGLTNLGTDLSDDHPISFQYTQGLATQDGQLVNPGLLPPSIRLDSSSQVQCTSCHDAHNNSHGSFLVMDNAYSGLCVACHSMNGWTAGAHRTSAASTAGATGVSFPFSTVGENACRSCHRPHTAGGHARLNIFDVDEDNCLDCHNGSVARTNIRAQLDKFSAHDPRRYAQLHDPTEAANVPPAHVECADCHNPHAVFNEPAAPGYIQIGNTLRRSHGVTAGGSGIQEAQYEYEICLRCHGDTTVTVSGRIGRHSDVPNLRLRFANTNASFHPVFASVVGSETISLIPGMPHGSMIRCTDCHNNDQGRRAGFTGPDGPHGSTYDFLLERNYNTLDNVVESAAQYAMCYKCHSRSSILGNQSFPEHYKHIVEERTPCSVCHDPHGVSAASGSSTDRTHLINFDTRIVQPRSGVRQFRDLGHYRGSCTLVCHGESHSDWSYP